MRRGQGGRGGVDARSRPLSCFRWDAGLQGGPGTQGARPGSAALLSFLLVLWTFAKRARKPTDPDAPKH